MRDEDLQHGGDKVQGGDPGLLNQIGKVGGILVAARFGEHQPRTGHKGPEELPNGDIETGRGLLQHPIRRADGIHVLHPEQSVDDGTMAHHHSFGPTGRT